MGARIIAEFLNVWAGQIGHRDSMGFVAMGLTAKDDDMPRLYWGGMEPIANAVGADWQGNPESAKRTVMKVIKSLTDAGLIVSSGQARMGVRAEYAITLDPLLTYQPTGSGRAIKWKPVPRADPRVNKPDTLQGERNVPPALPETFTQPTNETFTQPTNETFTPRNHRGTTKEYADEQNHLDDQVTWVNTSANDESETIEEAYALAYAKLSALPDNGVELMAKVEAEQPELAIRQRVIRAAEHAPKHLLRTT